ncbi:iron-dicitrate ABC transporter ATP-binding protein [Paenibacillus lautus]|uniref:ABC transporter ATP-binding protein n=1 Tax=Paenibacillus lautus TaxID=1401 RepID=UPI001B25FAA7|nr:ABC transporter ATP-binding protein [Paenibacillus lautus]GIP07232.1 iron-dicitrate ABC transporter ATP-binding protein [Paenibacillus lautus]
MIRLSTDRISVGYGENLILNRLNVDIPDKRITTIIGPNGCGKSTLLKAVTRIIPYQSGAAILDGEEIAKMNTKLLAKKLAILPQTPEGPGGLTVGELVSYGRYPHQRGFGRLTKQDMDVIDWALEVTGTQDYKYRSVDALSGGQRQRVWIAMALAQETEMIFLDEPTTYLDMAHQLEILELLERLNIEQERTIVMVLHDLNQAARFADYIIAMKDGDIIQAGDPEAVISHEVLKKVFHIDAEIGRDPRTAKPICITYNLLKGEKEGILKTAEHNDNYEEAAHPVYRTAVHS